MPACAVYGCFNHYRKTKGIDIKYYKFPKNEELCKQWLVACGRGSNMNIKTAYVCSRHFTPDSFFLTLRHQLLNYKPKRFRNLKPDAVPTENLPGEKGDGDLSESEIS